MSIRRIPIAARLVLAALALAPGLAPAPARASDMQGTLSIIGMERGTGAIGVAVVSHAPACGAEVPWVQAGIGAVATQGDVNADWGPAALGLLREGMEPQALCDTLYKRDPSYLRRQIGVSTAAAAPADTPGSS